MNDSFLEEIGVVEQQTGFVVRSAERHITTKRSYSPVSDFPTDQSEFESLLNQLKNENRSSLAMPKPRRSVEENNSQGKPSRRLTDTSPNKRSIKDSKSPGSKARNFEKKGKIVEGKLKPVENVENRQQIHVGKSQSTASGSSRENSRLSDGSCKENSRPSDSSGENIMNVETHKERKKNSSDTGNKKFNSTDGSESFAMLNAVKDIVSSYTKIESAKVMRMMQDLYINSQSNLMKQILSISDEIKDQNPGQDSSRFQLLVQENAKLSENITYLRNKVEELQRSQEDFDKLRQENSALRMRLCEYEK